MFDKRMLSNGVRALFDPYPGPRSVALGVWAAAGSRCETGDEAGAAHFLEHMLFKGTARRDYYQIALESNALGSHVNAFTSEEAVCLHARTIDDKLEAAVDLLCDLFANSLLDPQEFERERHVILDELMLYEDTPDERVNDLFSETLWSGHPLGRPVLGSEASLRAMSVKQLRGFQARWFQPERALVCVAGAFDPAACLGMLEQRLGQGALSAPPVATPAFALTAPQPTGQTRFLERPLEQVHFCLGVPGPARNSDERFALALLNQILGGAMSSRLFQEIREKRGLAYSIGSYGQGFHDTGYLAIAGGAGPEQIEETLDICWREVRRICAEDVSADELRNAKDMLRTSLLLSLESANSRMNQLAEQELYFGREVPLAETLDGIERATAGDLRACAERYLKDQPVASAFIGPAEVKSVVGARNRF